MREKKKVKSDIMPSGPCLQSQVSGRLRHGELKFKAFLGFKACLGNLVRPPLKIKTFKEGRGHGSVVEYLTNVHEKAQTLVSRIKTNQPKTLKSKYEKKYINSNADITEALKCCYIC